MAIMLTMLLSQPYVLEFAVFVGAPAPHAVSAMDKVEISVFIL